MFSNNLPDLTEIWNLNQKPKLNQKSVWNQSYDFLSFLLDWRRGHLEMYIFAESSTWIGPVVPKLWAIEGFSKQQETKEFIPFFGYLTTNAPDFRLIPLDGNTYNCYQFTDIQFDFL